jgi:hypothetical protein
VRSTNFIAFLLSAFSPGYEASLLFGVGVPKNPPAEIIEKLNNEINAALGRGSRPDQT